LAGFRRISDEDIARMMCREKGYPEEFAPYIWRRESYCSITNMKCVAAGRRSGKPSKKAMERVCREHCPWGMEYHRLQGVSWRERSAEVL